LIPRAHVIVREHTVGNREELAMGERRIPAPPRGGLRKMKAFGFAK